MQSSWIFVIVFFFNPINIYNNLGEKVGSFCLFFSCSKLAAQNDNDVVKVLRKTTDFLECKKRGKTSYTEKFLML